MQEAAPWPEEDSQEVGGGEAAALGQSGIIEHMGRESILRGISVTSYRLLCPAAELRDFKTCNINT